MAVEDFLESEVAIAIAATAAAISPPVRRVLRRGAVYGIAGVMIAGDAIMSFARGVGNGVQQATTSATNAVQQATAKPEAGTEAAGGEA